MTHLITSIKKIRAIFIKRLKSRDRYFLSQSLKPISTKFGFDRGTPIDRYYIEDFLEINKSAIKGRCLEVVDNTYTKRFGNSHVTKSDIIDNDNTNKQATIIEDLRNMSSVKNNTYDCLIITQTLGMIDDYQKAIKELYRVLKKDGILLLTVSAMSPDWQLEKNYWRFTVDGAKYAFKQVFNPKNLTVNSYGNVLSAYSFLVGLAQEDMPKNKLIFNDPHFPLIITVKAKK